METFLSNLFYDIYEFLSSFRFIIFIVSVAIIMAIRNILIEEVEHPILAKSHINIKMIKNTTKYTLYCIKNANKYRLKYEDFIKEERLKNDK